MLIYRKELFGAEGIGSGGWVAGRWKRPLQCPLRWNLVLHHAVLRCFGIFRAQEFRSGAIRLLSQVMSWLPFTYPCLRLGYCCNAAARAGGRGSIVAMITMAAPQAGQMIAGRCLRWRTRTRQGAVRSTSCRKRTSFLLHAWRKLYDLEQCFEPDVNELPDRQSRVTCGVARGEANIRNTKMTKH